jgi:hypothetical protein
MCLRNSGGVGANTSSGNSCPWDRNFATTPSMSRWILPTGPIHRVYKGPYPVLAERQPLHGYFRADVARTRVAHKTYGVLYFVS